MQPEAQLFFSFHYVWILQLDFSVYTEIRINVNHLPFSEIKCTVLLRSLLLNTDQTKPATFLLPQKKDFNWDDLIELQ